MSTLQKPSNNQQPPDNQHSADNQQQPNPSAVGWIKHHYHGFSAAGWIKHHYHRLKENAINYPYVWASYGVVYIGFGLYTAYRWTKLRRTEDRVRALQAKLLKQFEAREAMEAMEAKESATSKAVLNRTVTSTAVPEKTASSTIVKAEEPAASATVTDKALPFEDKPIK